MKKRTVALYGRNLVLSTIGACLQQKQEFRVVQIEGSLEDYLNKMGTARPEVILFDLAMAKAHFAVSLMHHHPEIKLVGVDLTTHKMLVLSGESSRLLTIEDLVTVIEKRPFPKEI
ncbi:MAG: response regulator transcription factor [Deltaproteobacteria bacterium]|nr:response regulator transcription factor [Deltaproteobacteria bacterium]